MLEEYSVKCTIWQESQDIEKMFFSLFDNVHSSREYVAVTVVGATVVDDTVVDDRCFQYFNYCTNLILMYFTIITPDGSFLVTCPKNVMLGDGVGGSLNKSTSTVEMTKSPTFITDNLIHSTSYVITCSIWIFA